MTDVCKSGWRQKNDSIRQGDEKSRPRELNVGVMMIRENSEQ